MADRSRTRFRAVAVSRTRSTNNIIPRFAGGTFHPVIFNWMVHVYPFETEQANIWSVERQHGDTD